MLNSQGLLYPVIQLITPFLEAAFAILRTWWWVLPPFLLWGKATYFWIEWRTTIWASSWDYTILEVIPPEDNEKPIRAMEKVIDGIWQTFYDPPNWYEKWWEGEYQTSVSFEMAAYNGSPHFLIRFREGSRDIVESNVYAQYQDAEIREVEDYTKNVPQTIPDSNWDLWGCSYKLLNKNDAYPIRTYRAFETEREQTEEKRIDPMATLLEGMGKINEGEQLWIQLTCKPIAQDMAEDFNERAAETKEEVSKRAEGKSSPENKGILLSLFNALFLGKDPGAEDEEEEEQPSFISPEMRMTPGEREVLEDLERKKSKSLFKTNIRFIYLGNKDTFFKPKLRLPFGYFVSFNKSDSNGLVPYSPTITKFSQKWHNWFLFKKRREYVLKKRLIRYYRKRKHPFYPADAREGRFVLNVEEVASLFHFPHREAVPAPLRPSGGAKKKGVSTMLPSEEE